MEIKDFANGEIIEGNLYKKGGRLWLAKKSIKSTTTAPKEGANWEEITQTLGKGYRYDVEEIGMKKYRATPKKGAGLKSFEGRDLHQVLQSCSDAMCQRIEIDTDPILNEKGELIDIKVINRGTSQNRGGGDIVFQGLEGVLWNTWSIKRWEDWYSVSPIRILGEGICLLKQWNGDKSLLTYEGGLRMELRNVNFEVGHDALHAVHFKKTAGNELSVNAGIIYNCYAQSFSTRAETFRLENFFNMSIDRLEIRPLSHTGLHFVNDSHTTNYGNSEVGTVWIQSSVSEHAALKFSSLTPHKNINLIDVKYAVIGSIQGQNFDSSGNEQGQEIGAGILLDGAETITIRKSDIEYQPNPLEVKRGAYNSFYDGYINTAKNGTAIKIGDKTNTNYFEKFVIHGHQTQKLLEDKSVKGAPLNHMKDFNLYYNLDLSTIKPSNTKIENWVQDGTMKEVNYG